MNNNNNYWIYETYCTETNKWYRGVHNFDSNIQYVGSGIEIRKDIRKYGYKAFKVTKLVHAETVEEAILLEKQYVNDEWVNRPDTYNRIRGGSGSLRGPTKETVKNMSKARIGMKLSDDTKEKMSRAKRESRWFNDGFTNTRTYPELVDREKFPFTGRV